MTIQPRNHRLYIEFVPLSDSTIVLPDEVSGTNANRYKVKVIAIAPDCAGAYAPGDFIILNPETRNVYPITDSPKRAIVSEDVVLAVVKYDEVAGQN